MFPYPNTYFDILFILSIGIYGNVWYSAAKNVILHLIKMSMELKEHFNSKIFALISETADELGLECYVVGGYVRDIFLNRPSKDIDVVVVGSGIEIAQAFGKKLGRGAHVSVFKNFGTAQVKFKDTEVEFVGARKESYSHDSRKPIVEDGTLEDDQNRRDFTINAMAVCLNKKRFGELVDPFGGMDDLKERTIRTPLDPDITFSDDPLRMMRCIRFATQLNFYIDDETFEALSRNKERIHIISKERIADELNKILLAPIPSKGFIELDRCGLLPLIFPEFSALQGVDVKNGRAHKDNFYHTLEVVDNISKHTDNLWLRWATLLHDIGKAIDHEVEGSHVTIGVNIARKYKESEEVIHAIEAHHGDVEAHTVVACLVQAADAISAARPGARRENIENYVKRLEKLEEVTKSFPGIANCFAIQAGREIRIMVKPEEVSEDQMVLLARDIAKKIEDELTYPGQIKVNLLRETKAIDYAK